MGRKKTPSGEETPRKQADSMDEDDHSEEEEKEEEEDEKEKEDEMKDNPAALRGKFDAEYPLTSKIVRIFTSSTFTDTKVERNALMERVYPVLKEFCQERGYDFQVVDMRWGVRDEATDDHMTSQLCMTEITNCQKYSTGPNFITFLAQKYGYRPFPPRIPTDEFEQLVSAVDDSDDRTLLSDWFLLDDNSVPAHYQLQPIRDKLPNYADDSDPDKKKEARREWWSAFERMQIVLREASTKALDDPEKVHKYHWSVTEEEIQNGLLKSSDPATECYWFRRNFPDLLEHTTDKIAKRFMDVEGNGEVDQPAFDFLKKLKEEQIPEKLPEENIMDYEVQWTPNGVDPTNSEEHAEYLEKFLVDFERELKRMIEAGIEAKQQDAVTDPLSLECIEQVTFAKNKAAIFQGRQKVMDEIKTKLVGDEKVNEPLVLLGEPGSGKTTLMAKLTELLPQWLAEDAKAKKTETEGDGGAKKKKDVEDDYEDDFEEADPEDNEPVSPAVIRFIGTTAKSSTTREMLSAINQQIISLLGKGEEVATDLKELKSQFLRLVSESSAPLLLILDSLDQLRDHGSGLKDWIPKSLPATVTMVMSAIPADEFIVGPELKRFLPDECFLDVPLLEEEEVGEIIQYSLERGKRTLQEPQLQILEQACRRCALPLYIKVAVDEACRWRSHTLVSPAHLGAVVHDLVEDLLERTEKYHGKLLVSHALGYVTAAKSGLSTPEIQDVLSCDDVVLKDVLQYHVPPQRRLPPLLWVRIQSDLSEYLVSGGADGGVQVFRWYHRQFNTVAQQRYLAEEEQRRFLNTSLAEYFDGRWANGEEKPYVDHKSGTDQQADRFVAKQPYVFTEQDAKKTVFNLRKMSELPYQLIKAGDLDMLKEKTLCNFEFLYEKIRAVGFDGLYDDFEQAKKDNMFDADLKKVAKTLLQAKDGLVKGPYNLSTQIVGRLGDKEMEPKKEEEKEKKEEEEEENGEQKKNEENEDEDDDNEKEIKKRNDEKKGRGDNTEGGEDEGEKEEDGEVEEKEEKKKDYVVSLVQQALTPHFPCLVTRQPFMKASGSALINKLVGHEMAISTVAINHDTTMAASADMTGTICIWDLESANCKQSFKLDDVIMPNQICFIESDQALLVIAMEKAHVIDLASETIRESVAVCEQGVSSNPNHAASIHFTDDKLLVVMTDGPEIRALEFPGSGKTVVKITDLEPTDTEDTARTDFMGGIDEDMVVYRSSSTKIHFFSLRQYKKTLTSVDLYKKTKDKTVVKVVVTPSGLAGVYIYTPPEHLGGKLPEFKDFPAHVLVYDIRKKMMVRKVENILAGYAIGLESLAYMEDDRVLMNSYQGQFTQYQEIDLAAGTYKVALAMREGMVNKMVACADRVIGVPMSEHLVIVQYDLTLGEGDIDGDKDGDGTPDWYDEGYLLKGFIPGSKRFVLYATLASNSSVWDLATSTTVRSFKGVGIGSEACWLDDRRVVQPLQKGLLTIDMYELCIINNLPGILADSCDNPPRFGMAEKDVAVIAGPNNNQISFVNLNTGRAVKKFIIEGKDVKLGGVVVSEDHSIALASHQQFTAGLPSEGPKDGVAKLYVFDLKKRERLPDITMTEQERQMYVSAISVNQAALTADGEKYANLVYAKTTEIWVWETRTGKGEKIPVDEYESITTLTVSNVLRCFVLVSLGAVKKLRLWNYDQYEDVKTIMLQEDSQVARIKISGDEKHLAMAEGHNVGAVVNLETGQLLYRVAVPSTILAIDCPDGGDYFLITATGVQGMAQFFWARPQEKLHAIEQAEKMAEEEEDLMGEPKFVNQLNETKKK